MGTAGLTLLSGMRPIGGVFPGLTSSITLRSTLTLKLTLMGMVTLTGKELTAGTDPYDPASRPLPRSPTSPWVDTDGDGYPDSQEIAEGTDPRDASSHPDPATTPPQQKPEQNPDSWPGGPPAGRIDPVQLPELQVPERQRLPEWDRQNPIAEAWKEEVVARVQRRLSEIRDILEDRFPFGLVMRVDFRVSYGSASCAYQVPFPPPIGTLSVDICSTPIWQMAAGFRPVLEGLLWLGLGFMLIRRALDVQR